jgi:hypothetical protein
MKRSFPHLLVLCLALLTGFFNKGFSQSVVRADPPNWWTGMKHNKVEILFNAKYIAKCRAFVQSEHCKITRTTPLPNPDYLLVEIEIAPDCPAGKVEFSFASSRNDYKYEFPIEGRSTAKTAKGLNASDLIYLVFPDRFANGDPSNDNAPTLLEPKADRTGLKTRHGGDIAGIEQHLDYFTQLGVTALWLNPVLENNQPYESYHGYAATDLYMVDPRLGTNEGYKNFVKQCHQKGIKVIWDVVYNHWGNEHHLFKNLPDSNWVHWFPQFTRTSYRAETLMDPYASKADRDIMTNAWFDKHMPDLNQQDPHRCLSHRHLRIPRSAIYEAARRSHAPRVSRLFPIWGNVGARLACASMVYGTSRSEKGIQLIAAFGHRLSIVLCHHERIERRLRMGRRLSTY